MTTVNVYRLQPPRVVFSSASAVRKALFNMGAAEDGSRTFTMSPVTGCWAYHNFATLWKGPGLDSTRASAQEQAEKAGQAFLERGQRALGRLSDGSLYPLATLLPSTLRMASSGPAPAATRTEVDHWVVHFAAVLPTSLRRAGAPAGGLPPEPSRPSQLAAPQPPSAPVAPVVGDPEGQVPEGAAGETAALGAGVTLRVGADGEIRAAISRWRPVKQVIVSALLPLPVESTAPTLTSLVYLGAGPEEPLEYLSPYYLSADDDTGTFSPASLYSFTVGIRQAATATGTHLAANISGGSGHFRYAWSSWSLLGQPCPSGGGTNSWDVPSGVHNIVLDVEDRVTQAFKRTQAMVYGGTAGHEPAP